MKFTVISRGDDGSNTVAEEIQHHLGNRGLIIDDKNPDIVITVGGDGTLLHAFHRYKHILNTVSFVGLHTGHLGFYTDWSAREMVFLALEIVKNPGKIVKYPLLDMVINYNDGTKAAKYLALNEVTIRSAVGNTMVADIELRKSFFERFRGDGLCFSTPSGSTAYNKSLGGAIIHPSISCMQMAEMASINNRVYRTIGSPLVLPGHHTCVLRPLQQREFNITVDHLHFVHANVQSIKIAVSKETIQFSRFRPFPFWKRVRESFIGDKKR